MIGALAVLSFMGVVYALLLRGRAHAWNPRRANMRVDSMGGHNLTTMLAVVGLATLVIKLGASSFVVERPFLVPWLAGGVVALVVGYVLLGSVTKVIVAALAIGLLVMNTGITGAIQLCILSALLFWILGAARGWFA